MALGVDTSQNFAHHLRVPPQVLGAGLVLPSLAHADFTPDVRQESCVRPENRVAPQTSPSADPMIVARAQPGPPMAMLHRTVRMHGQRGAKNPIASCTSHLLVHPVLFLNQLVNLPVLLFLPRVHQGRRHVDKTVGDLGHLFHPSIREGRLFRPQIHQVPNIRLQQIHKLVRTRAHCPVRIQWRVRHKPGRATETTKD